MFDFDCIITQFKKVDQRFNCGRGVNISNKILFGKIYFRMRDRYEL
jgi:hypothetical protein